MQTVFHRLKLVFKSWFHQPEPDPLQAFDTHIKTIEKKTNNLAILLGRARANESVVKSNLHAALNKLDKLKERIATMPQGNSIEKEELVVLKKRYEKEALAIGEKLEKHETKTVDMEKTYNEFRSMVHDLIREGEDLKDRYYLADAAHTIYSDSSGLTSRDGRSSLDRLVEKVIDIESRADAAFELLNKDVRIDMELKRSMPEN